MGAKHIPEVGEIFKGYIPGVRKVAHVSFGVASASPDVTVAEIAAAVQLVDVTVPVIVFGMWTQVEEAFTASVTATIGDTGGADRYFADTTINIAASGAILVSSTGLTVPYVDQTGLDITVDIGGATVAAGLCHVYIEYAELHD
jgi:hypothetical protein